MSFDDDGGGAVRDEFAAAGINDESDLVRMYGRQFFYGCEPDGHHVHRVLGAAGNPLGVAYPPLFSSAFGYGDVVASSRRLVERGLLSDRAYRRFVLDEPVRLHTTVDPGFFDGTAVESPARDAVARARSDST